MALTPEELSAYATEFERLWRSRTPCQDINHALPDSRVTFTDMNMWFHSRYGRYLEATDRLEIHVVLRPVFRRLRKEFPNEQWG